MAPSGTGVSLIQTFPREGKTLKLSPLCSLSLVATLTPLYPFGSIVPATRLWAGMSNRRANGDEYPEFSVSVVAARSHGRVWIYPHEPGQRPWHPRRSG